MSDVVAIPVYILEQLVDGVWRDRGYRSCDFQEVWEQLRVEVELTGNDVEWRVVQAAVGAYRD